jgi:hypothetical protein
MTYDGDEAFPALSDEQWARLQAYGSAQEAESGVLLFGAGQATHDLILVDSGEVEVVRAATARAAEAVVAGFLTSFDAGIPLREVQEAASHAHPGTTMRYDRARGSLDRHATYIVAAYVAGAAR